MGTSHLDKDDRDRCERDGCSAHPQEELIMCRNMTEMTKLAVKLWDWFPNQQMLWEDLDDDEREQFVELVIEAHDQGTKEAHKSLEESQLTHTDGYKSGIATAARVAKELFQPVHTYAQADMAEVADQVATAILEKIDD